ncbi:Rid family hydrolase [Haloplanus sp.]|uniref:Rid family hydrolase n=1 Tax=Haloplanus sp. TaxID=1961696 RepID=UPI0026254931|nr:Rid family hydrolase [Haloplanus sp.]
MEPEGTTWETAADYSRAVRAGDALHVSGSMSTDDAGHVGGGPYERTARAPEIIDASPSEPDASLDDVVRTRLFVTDIEDWEAVGRAHAEAFGDARPAATTVQVERLTDPESLVERKATAKAA